MTEAERIIQRLNQTARSLYPEYGIAVLIFSNGAGDMTGGVSRTDWNPGPLEEVETLLQTGERPLGIIAPLQDRKAEPYIEPWESSDEKARERLYSVAKFWWHHRM